MRLSQVVALFVAGFLTNIAVASPDNPLPGKEYTVLVKRQQPALESPGKTEVIEFFMYHCPACNAFEPELATWVKARGDAVMFRRVHLPRLPENDPEAHLFLTLEAMQMETALHDKVMRTWHVERRRLANDTDNLEWAASNGIDRQKFGAVYNSFSVNARLRNLTRYVSNYGVDSTPTIVVDGRFLTNPSMVAAANPGLADQNVGAATLRVVDALIARARKESK